MDENRPSRPMEMCASDLFQISGLHYLFLVDCFTGYSWSIKFKVTPSTQQVTDALKSIFLQFGFPLFLRTDGGGQYRTGFTSFCKENEIEHQLSSAFNPSSNGSAERNLGLLKMLIARCKDNGDNFEDALSVFRATPRYKDGLSPSRLFFQRQVRIPNLPSLDDGKDEELAGFQLRAVKDEQKEARNERVSKHLSAPLTLRVGARVLLQNMDNLLWNKPGKIAGIRNSGRSAHVDCGGKLFLRNRRFIRLDPEYLHDEQLITAVFDDKEQKQQPKSILFLSGNRKNNSRKKVSFSPMGGLSVAGSCSAQDKSSTASVSLVQSSTVQSSTASVNLVQSCVETTTSESGRPLQDVSCSWGSL